MQKISTNFQSATPMEPGGVYANYGSSAINYGVGGDIGDEQVIILNAHIHLDVSGVVWHENNHAWTHTFTKDDNMPIKD